MKKIVLTVAERLWLPTALIAAWWLLSANSTNAFLPPLSSIVETLRDDFASGLLFGHMRFSLTNLAVGLGIAIVLGIVGGLVLGERSWLRETVDPMLHFFRAIPQSALVPLIIGALGIGAEPKIAVIAFACLWPVLLNTIDGVRGVDPAVREFSRTYRIPGRLHFFRIILFSSLPQIMAGIRVALPIGVVVMVVTEIFSAQEGVGYYIQSSASLFRMRETWAGAILVGVIGFILSALFVAIERRILHWHLRPSGHSTGSSTKRARSN